MNISDTMYSTEEENAFSKIHRLIVMGTKQWTKTKPSKGGTEGNLFILIKDIYRDLVWGYLRSGIRQVGFYHWFNSVLKGSSQYKAKVLKSCKNR